MTPTEQAIGELYRRERLRLLRVDARRPLHPAGDEAALRRLYDRRRARALAVIREAARRTFGVQVRADADADDDVISREDRLDFARLIRALGASLGEVTPAEQRELERIGRRIVKWTLKNGDAQLSALLGRPVPPGWAMTEALGQSYLEDFLTQNTGALSDLSKDLLRDVRSAMTTASGLDIDAAAKLLTDRYRVTASKATFYAEDQAKKLQGAIDRGRFDRLGIESYIWRSVGDNRVRPEHRERDGKEFSWSAPPPDGHPSEPYGCRCYAEPVLEGVDLPDLGDPNFLDPWTARLLVS